MPTLFDSAARGSIQERLARLDPRSERQWGKMDTAQTLTHCALALEMATGERPVKRALIGRILGPFFRGTLVGDKPFSRNSPTNPVLVVADARDFAVEKARLTGVLTRFCE